MEQKEVDDKREICDRSSGYRKSQSVVRNLEKEGPIWLIERCQFDKLRDVKCRI